ncbi:uncharacterized protein Dvir_GJ25698 [Drosophila virilis]|uniref:Uncharacterized protein n=1 Tax=Drosophila virilis TaxID=7244 RepID=A0A0Q9WDA3_DROVI|nr:uncharacterized protein Dvir_GJ25698 [Drosophila virilis]
MICIEWHPAWLVASSLYMSNYTLFAKPSIHPSFWPCVLQTFKIGNINRLHMLLTIFQKKQPESCYALFLGLD